ncbi:cytochrome-c peroxidase [Mucilaginibacter sp. FT3.2]|uniref:cytochrome-c peroxidase n=1 Tax=Mucilaginibacter sp. FT3.2 TaxID=2723090 RepID=UPI00161911E8|nr:cytochrome c peroxidase [Mucilaginibacter sp. FT3.2]
MKKYWLIFGVILAISANSIISCSRQTVLPEKAIAVQLVANIDSFTDFIDKQLLPAIKKDGNEQQLQRLFLQTRLLYKKYEWAAEYFNPALTRLVNGAPVVEVEPGSRQVMEPEGLQVIEALLYPGYKKANKQELITRLERLSSTAGRYKDYFNNIDMLRGQVFDAAKLQVFRVITVGITAFDDPLSLNSLQEASVSLNSLKEVLGYYPHTDSLQISIDDAINYLNANTNFNTFNRAVFITAYANTITRSITRLEKKQNIPVIKYNRLLRQDAETLFDKDAFNADAYTPCEGCTTTPQKTALGKKLFFDPILSGSLTRSCASCHQPDKAFTDGLVKNTMLNSKRLLSRNTPGLINAALQPGLFYDLRSASLEAQAKDVMQNAQEMHGSMEISAAKLWKDKEYQELFAAAYPANGRTAIDTLEIMNALGSYIRSLVKLDSRFDKYMRGERAALTSAEINGFNLFMGKAKCGTCHYMPLFNGVLPPRFVRMETEVIGVPQAATGKTIDPDLGRYNIIPEPSLKYAFKTTTVRNTALTAPYMHNGVFSNLDQVVDFYNDGGGEGQGLLVDNQTLSSGKLNLTVKEKSALISFIKSLNDE